MSDELVEAIRKENKRVGFEWDGFLAQYPPHDPEAVELAEKQALRLNRITSGLGYRLDCKTSVWEKIT